MAITVTHLLTNGSNADADSYITGTINPPANQLILLWVAGHDNAGTVHPAGDVTGCGLLWQGVSTVERGVRTLRLYRAIHASPSSGALTIPFASTQLGCWWSVIALDGIETGGSNGDTAIVQSVTGSFAAATEASITLAAFGNSNNATVGGFFHAANEGTTPGNGFTEMGDFPNSAPNGALATEFRADNDTTVDASWSTSSVSVGIATEIKAGLAPPASNSNFLAFM